jgi:hypothetical protein
VSLFNGDEFAVCVKCKGTGLVWDDRVGAERVCPEGCSAPRRVENLPVADSPSGHVGPSPEDTIREAFLRFHAENPHVYMELVKLTHRAKHAGASKIGIGMLFEVLRWRHTMRTGGDDFKLNNNYRSYYARLIMAREPGLGDIFELRRLHGQGLADDDVA